MILIFFELICRYRGMSVMITTKQVFFVQFPCRDNSKMSEGKLDEKSVLALFTSVPFQKLRICTLGYTETFLEESNLI